VNPKTNLVVLAGGGLLAANVIADPTFDSLRADTMGGKLTLTAVESSSPLKMVLIGLLTLIVLSAIADDSDTAANAILVALAALWVLWLMNRGSSTTATGGVSTTATTSTTTTPVHQTGSNTRATAA
jgi:hypothetical protein